MAVSSANALAQKWSDDAEAVGTFVAVNGADVTTESGGVVRSIEFEAGQPVAAGAVLVRLNTANEEATLKALELSEARYRLGADSYLPVLDAQRSLYSAQQTLIGLALAEQANRITLYKVLGGGWSDSTPDDNATTPGT